MLHTIREIDQLIIQEKEQKRIQGCCDILIDKRGYDCAVIILTDEKGVPSSTASAGVGETVLLVEDELAVLKLGKRLLTDLGYKVLDANAAGEALDLPGSIRVP